MPEPEELHVIGLCQHCSGNLRFPPRGEGMIIGCPHCGNSTVLKVAVAPPKIVTLEPYPVRRMPKPWSWREHKGVIFGACIAAFCVCFLLVYALLDDKELRETFGIGFSVIISFAIAAVIYFLPSIIASHHKHPQQTAISVLNLVAGWTIVGWIIALVWAFTTQPPAKRE